MRHSLSSHYEVCHLWANQMNISNPKDRYAKAQNVFFDADDSEKIWSYGYHYCLARMIDNQTVLLNDTYYSSTTANHQSSVWGATSHFAHRIFCPDPNSMNHCMRVWESRMHDILENLSVARKPEKYLNELKSLFKNIQEYADVTKENLKSYEWWMKVKRTRNLDRYLFKLAEPLTQSVREERAREYAYKKEMAEQRRRIREENNARWEAQRRLFQEEQERRDKDVRENWATYLAQWQAGEKSSLPSFPSDLYEEHPELRYEFLREKGYKGRLETSKNVVIPRDIARKFGERLKNGLLQVGESLMNYYRVSQCDSEITRIGCHTFQTPYLIQWYDKLAAEV